MPQCLEGRAMWRAESIAIAAGQAAQAANQESIRLGGFAETRRFASTNNDSFQCSRPGRSEFSDGRCRTNLDGQQSGGGGVLTNGESGVSLGNLSLNDLTLSGSHERAYPFLHFPLQ